MKWILGSIFCLMILSGCSPGIEGPVCYNDTSCKCGNTSDKVGLVTVEYVGLKYCNCCASIPYMNEEGYYETKRVCEGHTRDPVMVCK